MSKSETRRLEREIERAEVKAEYWRNRVYELERQLQDAKLSELGLPKGTQLLITPEAAATRPGNWMDSFINTVWFVDYLEWNNNVAIRLKDRSHTTGGFSVEMIQSMRQAYLERFGEANS